MPRALKPIVLTLFLAACAAMPPSPAQAGLVLRFQNSTQLEVKAIVQNVGVVWIKRGQSEVVRHTGDWLAVCRTANCAHQTVEPFESFVAQIEHVQSNNMPFCTWNLRRTLHPPKPGSGSNGFVSIEPRLAQEARGYKCSTSGPATAPLSERQTTEDINLGFSVTTIH